MKESETQPLDTVANAKIVAEVNAYSELNDRDGSEYIKLTNVISKSKMSSEDKAHMTDILDNGYGIDEKYEPSIKQMDKHLSEVLGIGISQEDMLSDTKSTALKSMGY